MKNKGKELKEKRIAREESDESKENAGNQFGGHKVNNQQNRSD